MPFFYNRSKKKFNLISSYSDIGPTRKINGDTAFAGTNNLLDHLLIVCDGVGSYSGSKMAANILTNVFVNSFLKFQYLNSSIDYWFNSMIKTAKHLMNQHIAIYPKDVKMATTLVLCLIINKNANIFWSGDSRAYLITKRKINLLTKDHNLANWMYDKGYTEKEISTYGKRTLALTGCVTADLINEQIYGWKRVKVKKNGIFLLASDGFYNFFDLSNFKSLIKKHRSIVINESSFNQSLVKKAIDNGSDDNISFSYFLR